METIFISYDRDDYAVAQKIYDTLLNRPDIEPWIDLKQLKLVEWDQECKRKIEESSYILVLISSASLSSSGYVVEEWDYALSKNKRRLPVLLNPTLEKMPELPAIVKGVDKINWVRLYESFEDGMRKILREIYGDLAKGTFRETFSSLGPDHEDWRFDGWKLDDADAGNQNSQSIVAEVAPSFYSQRQTRVAAIPIKLDNHWSRIAYVRKLMLRRAHISATARFQVTLSDGSHVVPIEDIELKGMGSLGYPEDAEWTRVEQKLDLTRFPTRNVTLNFTLAASDTIAYPLTKGKAQVDNIWID